MSMTLMDSSLPEFLKRTFSIYVYGQIYEGVFVVYMCIQNFSHTVLGIPQRTIVSLMKARIPMQALLGLKFSPYANSCDFLVSGSRFSSACIFEI